MKSGNLNFLEPSGPLQACNGIALPLPYLYFNALWDPKCLQNVLYECEIHKLVYIGICVAVIPPHRFQYIQAYVFHIRISQSVSIWDTATQIPKYTSLCISHSYNTICKHLGSHNALKYR